MSNSTKHAYPLNLVADLSFSWAPIDLDAPPKDYDLFVEYVLRKVAEKRPRDVQIIRMRYQDDMTYRAIGECMGLTAERVRQIINKGLHLIHRWDLAPLITNGVAEYANKRGQELYKNGFEEGYRSGHSEGYQQGRCDGYMESRRKEARPPVLLPVRECDNLKLNELGFSTRTYNILRNAGKYTARDIATCTYRDLYRMRGCGAISLNEIIAKMRELGYDTSKMEE
jgi:hypothetical protein